MFLSPSVESTCAETLLSRDWKDRRDRLNASELLGEVKGETAVIHRLRPNNTSFLMLNSLPLTLKRPYHLITLPVMVWDTCDHHVTKPTGDHDTMSKECPKNILCNQLQTIQNLPRMFRGPSGNFYKYNIM